MKVPAASAVVLVETVGHTKWAEPVDDKKAARIIRKIRQLADSEEDAWWIAGHVNAVLEVRRRQDAEARARRARRAA